MSEDLFRLLTHPTRRKIIRLLGEKGYATFTTLSKIEPRVGLLYYHLNAMKPLIQQDKKKRYVLTELGQKIYKSLIMKEELIEEYENHAKIREDTKYFLFTSPVLIIKNFTESPLIMILISVMIVGVSGIIFQMSSIIPVVAFLIPTEDVNIPILLISYANWLSTSIVSHIISTLAYRRKAPTHFADLSLSFAMAQFPLIIFSLLWYQFPGLKINEPVSAVLLVVFQAWSLWLYTSGIKMTLKLSTKRAALIPLLTQYLGALIILYFL